MKRILFALLVMAAVAIGVPRSASAQTDPALVKVPFQFIVGDKVLPAGSYRIAAAEHDSSVLLITRLDGNAGAFAAVERADTQTTPATQARVAFKSVDGQYFLWRVSMPGTTESREVRVTRAQAERTLAKLNLLPAERADSAK